LFRHKETTDPDPGKSRWGAERHITDSLVGIGSYFRDGTLDAIVCNGVFGWGLDQKSEVEAAFRGCHACLRAGGVFVLGWNDIPARRPFALNESESLRLFMPYRFPPLAADCHRTGTRNRHTYNFYSR
jgi:SAM-dependent methyltransferase